MKTKAKIKSPQPRKPQPRLYIPSPRFVLIPFFGHQLRAVLEGEETWYVREDVLRVLSLNEAPYWNRRLFPNQRRTALVPDGDGGATQHQIVSEAGFYILLCLSKTDFGLTFKIKGGSLIFDMPGPGEDFDAGQREFFRKILRELHASWRQELVADSNIDEWEMSRRGKVRTWLLN
jgi:hypothetical protein